MFKKCEVILFIICVVFLFDSCVFSSKEIGIKIVSIPDKCLYVTGDKLDLKGLQVAMLYSNGEEELTTDYEVSINDGDVLNDLGVNVINVRKDLYEVDFNISVVEPVKEIGLKITEYPKKNAYYVGDKFELDGLKIAVLYSDATEEMITDYKTTIKAGDRLEKDGINKILVEYNEQEVFFNINVYKSTDERLIINKQPNKLTYKITEKLDLKGLEVKFLESDNTYTTIMDFETDPKDGYCFANLDCNSIKIKYGGFVKEIPVNILSAGGGQTYSVLTGKNIVCFGDSITQGQSGYEASFRNPWPYVLGKKTGANVINEGMCGSTLALVYDNEGLNKDSFIYRVKNYDFSGFDYCFIAYGTNDLSYRIPIGDVNDNSEYTFLGALNSGVNIIFEKNPNIKIVLLPHMLDSRLDLSYANAIKRFGEYHNIDVIDLGKLRIEEEDLNDLYWDHSTQMHPTDITYNVMGTYISHYPNFDNVSVYKINYESFGGYMDLKKSLVINDGYNAIEYMLTTVKQGSKFIGWYTEDDVLINEDTLYAYNRDITVYAKYIER